MLKAKQKDPPNAIEVIPESELQFTLNRTADTPVKCILTLRHPGTSDEHLAFKVKTTQPRRYLVRPNQGIIGPNGTQVVSIIMVDKDKQVLLQSYDSLGQSALDHSKDKFLVQSCTVSFEFAQKYYDERSKAETIESQKELSDALTSMWNVMATANSTAVFNKKLLVTHIPPLEAALDATAVSARHLNISMSAMDSMSPEQMFTELASLRKKYDELVSFSVNLTAERDILNNNLEQTKRDLNREMASRAALENSGNIVSSGGGRVTSKSSSVVVWLRRMIIFVLGIMAGVKLSQEFSKQTLEPAKTLEPVGEVKHDVVHEEVPDL